MKHLILILLLMTTLSTQAQEAMAHTTTSTFKQQTSVQIKIVASPEIIWRLLTTASDYP